MNLSWGWTVDKLADSGYPGLIGQVWIGELQLLLNQCIGIGLLVSRISQRINI